MIIPAFGHENIQSAAEEVVDLGHDFAGAYCLWALEKLRDVVNTNFQTCFFRWQLCIFVYFCELYFFGCSLCTFSCWRQQSGAEVFSVLFAQAVGDVLIRGHHPSFHLPRDVGLSSWGMSASPQRGCSDCSEGQSWNQFLVVWKAWGNSEHNGWAAEVGGCDAIYEWLDKQN